MQKKNTLSESDVMYLEKFQSTFCGVLYWPDLDEFWINLKQHVTRQWYIYDLNQSPPESTVNETDLVTFIDEMNIWLRETHREDFCGVVYADDKTDPTYIKIFHPKKMGYGACSINKESPLPGWVLSTLKPASLKTIEPVQTLWWKNFPFISKQI